MAPETREPAVAGRFYPADPERIERELARYLAPPSDGPEPSDALAVVAPHAGWIYSGAIAGAVYARTRVPDRVVVLCPNHTGLGVRRSLSSAGAWRLPGGEVPVATELAQRLQKRAGLEHDALAHLREHAIEVHLPFLRAKNRAVSVVPICLGPLSFADCRKLGEGIAAVLSEESERVLIVASTDMSHYIAADLAKKLDSLALERVTELDAEGLYRVVTAQDISMCGYIPTTVTLIAARALGARRATFLRYGNSGETSGDYTSVVGYAALAIE